MRRIKQSDSNDIKYHNGGARKNSNLGYENFVLYAILYYGYSAPKKLF